MVSPACPAAAGQCIAPSHRRCKDSQPSCAQQMPVRRCAAWGLTGRKSPVAVIAGRKSKYRMAVSNTIRDTMKVRFGSDQQVYSRASVHVRCCFCTPPRGHWPPTTVGLGHLPGGRLGPEDLQRRLQVKRAPNSIRSRIRPGVLPGVISTDRIRFLCPA